MQDRLLTRKADLQRLCAELRELGRFALDTEFIGEGLYQPQLCLVQVATEHEVVLIDPLAMGNPVQLWSLITEEDVEVVVHGGRADVRLCYLWSGGKLPRRVFDVQVAAGLVGMPFPASYSLLVEEVLGVELREHATLSDWRQRPLSREQLRYAADDVRYLLQIRDRLAAELERLGRLAWAEEEFERRTKLAVAREEGEGEPWRKVKGARSLEPRQLAALKALFEWRQDIAYRENRPSRQVCPDHILVELARRMPTKPAAARVVRGLAARYVDQVVHLMRAVQQLSGEELPDVHEQDPPQLQLLTHLLSAVHQSLCMDYRIAPSLVATQQELKNWLRNRLMSKGPRYETPLESGWRRAAITPRLEACLEGKLTVRVRDPQAENPLTLRDLTE